MNLSGVHWLWALVGFVAVEMALIASAFAWVAIYSYLVHPGETEAFYQAYAEVASPWVSVIAGMPVFFLAGRWLGGRPTALAMFGLYLLVDLALLLAFKAPPPILLIGGLGYLVKLAACWLGAGSRRFAIA